MSYLDTILISLRTRLTEENKSELNNLIIAIEEIADALDEINCRLEEIERKEDIGYKI